MSRFHAFAALALGLALLSQPCSAESGDARVVGPHAEVVVEGSQVRIRDAHGSVVVDGWRSQGAGPATDSERLLVELGAHQNADLIQLDLAGDILFDFGSAELQASARQRLAQLAQLIRARAVGAVQVIGHTDAIGSDAANLALSRDRAGAVMRWLVAQEGIPGALLLGTGVGAAQPIAPNRGADGRDDPDGRARNRRVEVQIAQREGIVIGPGLVDIRPGRVEVKQAGVVVEDDRVMVSGMQIDLGSGAISGIPGLAATPAAPAPQASADVGGACTALCKATAGRHSLSLIGCFEGEFEELGYRMDSSACNELEGAMFGGGGNEGGSLCRRCQGEQGFGESHCATVQRKCFGR
jgi:outer membrane protein OmpA-like peptidoglycan-associated protein